MRNKPNDWPSTDWFTFIEVTIENRCFCSRLIINSNNKHNVLPELNNKMKSKRHEKLYIDLNECSRVIYCHSFMFERIVYSTKAE